jgi:Dna[CI] antecedent, DciA
MAFPVRHFFSDYNPAIMEPRRARGLEPLSVLGARGLGLSHARARELELEAAWRRVAGESLARRARVVALRRGVLELAVDGKAWRKAVEQLLPELGARLAREHASLGITRFRLLDANTGV